MKKLLSLLLVLVLAATFFVGCGTTEKPAEPATETPATDAAGETPEVKAETPEGGALVIGASMNSADEFRSTWLESFIEQAEAKGHKVISTNADNKADKQISDIESLIEQDIDVAIVHAFSTDGIVPALEALKTANIPVVLVDFPVESEDYNTLITDEQYENGVIQGGFVNNWLAEDPERVANVGYVVGSYSMEAAMPRMEGFFDTVTAANKMAEGEGGWSSDGAMTLTEDWMQVHPDMNVFVAMSDEMALGIIQALKGANINLDEVIILGIDGSKEGFAAIRAGELDATAARDIPKEAKVALEAAESILAGDTVEKTIRPEAITSVSLENIDQYS